MTSRTPDRVARSAIARSGVRHEAGRVAAQYLFLKNWIPDLRGGFAAACPGHEAADVIYAVGASASRISGPRARRPTSRRPAAIYVRDVIYESPPSMRAA